MIPYTFIVNPNAGKGIGARVAGVLRELLEQRRVPYELLPTGGPGDAMDHAKAAASPVVVAVGGDGTINEVVNGLYGSTKTLGIIPAGSGNDFIKSVAIPRTVGAALDVVLSGKTRLVDVGSVSCPGCRNTLEKGNSSPRSFINGVGVGFDAEVAARTREIRFLRGTALYLAAVLQTLGAYRAPTFTLRIDGESVTSRRLLIAIGNGRCAGGGFYLTPGADVGDRMLDVCAVDAIHVGRILWLMPKVMRGRHIDSRWVNIRRCKEIDISSESPFFVHADGEIVGENVKHVQLGIRDEQIKVLST